MSDERMRVAHTSAVDVDQIVVDLERGLGDASNVVVLFFAPSRPGAEVVQRLSARWPTAKIIGCSTAGEIATGRAQNNSVVAATLPKTFVPRAAVACADYSRGVARGIGEAVARLEETLEPLGRLDPQRYVGLIFIDSTHGLEEATHIELGNRAPLLPFVGGSAGDDLAFKKTEVVTSSGATCHGCALMVLEVARPFRVARACHFVPTAVHHRVTRIDGRRLIELDGEPAAMVYARHLGCTPETLSMDKLFMNPAGIVIDGQAWVRQANPPVVDHGAITLGCEVALGAELYFLQRRTDLVSHLNEEIAAARAELGEIRGALLFDCALRRLELEATHEKERYVQLIDFPAAGFHTHGESWLGHMHTRRSPRSTSARAWL
jgi:hypothetical protein